METADQSGWTAEQKARYEAEHLAARGREMFERVMARASKHLPVAIRETNRRLREAQERAR